MKMRISMVVDIDEAEMMDGQEAGDLSEELSDGLEQFLWDYSFVGDVGPISIQVTN